jgi:hypothetical protein
MNGRQFRPAFQHFRARAGAAPLKHRICRTKSKHCRHDAILLRYHKDEVRMTTEICPLTGAPVQLLGNTQAPLSLTAQHEILYE